MAASTPTYGPAHRAACLTPLDRRGCGWLGRRGGRRQGTGGADGASSRREAHERLGRCAGSAAATSSLDGW